MDLSDIERRGLVLLGCGKMGSALLSGWLDGGLPAASIWVVEPHPSDWLRGRDGLTMNGDLPPDPAMAVIAVKPQLMAEALHPLTAYTDGNTLFLSIAAGTPIRYFESALGTSVPIIRSMPNTPASVARGITALTGNKTVHEDHLVLAERLLASVGKTVRLSDESQMDAVTAVSGSGPAYVFHLIETLAAAGEAQGLPADLALKLARATVAGAGHLAENAVEDPARLRKDVTSPGGTTAAALEILMDPETGFPGLLGRAVAAATDRSRELGQ